MRITKIKTISAATLTLLFSCSTFAAQLPYGWYLEGNVGGSRISNANFGSGTSTTSSGVAYNVNAGYKFIPYFAAEVGYTRYAKIKISSPIGSATSTVQAGDVALKAIWPIGEMGFDLFTKIGEGKVYSKLSGEGFTSSTHSVTGLLVGVGASWTCNPNMPINVQWTRQKGDSTTGDLDLLTVGIAYIFD